MGTNWAEVKASNWYSDDEYVGHGNTDNLQLGEFNEGDISNYETDWNGGEPRFEDLSPEEQEQWAADDERLNTIYTPSWFIQEAENLRNPQYVSESDMDKESIEAIGNYASKMKDQNPDQWKYGDPGWSRDNAVWNEYIQPYEHNRRVKIEQEQAIQEQQRLQTEREGTPMLSDVPEDPRFEKSKVDTSGADYNKMTRSEKTIYMATPATAGTDIENAEGWRGISKWTKPIVQSLASSGGLPGIVRDVLITLGIPGAGWVYGGLKAANFVYDYGKAVEWWQGNKTIDKLEELSDIGDKKMQQVQGALAYGYEKAGGGNGADIRNLKENVNFIINNFGTIMHYAFGEGKASTEYASPVVGAVTGLTADMGADMLTAGGITSKVVTNILKWALDDNPDYVWYGEATRANSGLTGVFKLDEELTGTNAIMYWLERGQYWYNQGFTNEADIEALLNQEIALYYGDQANLSQFLEHEFTDAGNTIEGQQARAIKVYADVTRDTNLSKAAKANIGSFSADITQNIPIIPEVIRTIGKGVTGNADFWQTSGGILQIGEQWHKENLNSNVNELTARDRLWSDIDRNGVTREFTRNQTQPTTPIGNFVQKVTGLLQETNESRAIREGDLIFDWVANGIDDAMQSRGANEDPEAAGQRLREFVNELKNPEKISQDSPFYESSQKVLFQSIKADIAEAVTSREKEINDYIDQWNSNRTSRAVLDTLSTQLNMPKEKILDMYENNKELLTQMIVSKADENGGNFPGLEKIYGQDINVESPEFDKNVIQMLHPFVGDNPQSYDVRQLSTLMTTAIADGVADTLVAKYQIEPESMLYRFGNTVKDLQGLLLLGLSPSYLANNFVNNVATRTALGYGGFLSPKTINKWMDRFGYTPTRIAEGSNLENVTRATDKSDNRVTIDSGVLGEKIKEAKTAKGSGFRKDLANAMDKVSEGAKYVNKNVGVFSKLSEKVEKFESQQITASAMMNYMHRTWKEGVNFHRMDPRLEAEIERQTPGLTKTIYAAVRSGVNMDEIEKAIYGTYIIPSVSDTLLEIAQSLNTENASDFISEYFVKNGMMASLTDELRGKRGDEITNIVNKHIAQLKQTLKQQVATDVATAQEATKNAVDRQGYPPAMRAAYDMTDEMAEVWTNSIDSNEQVFRDRVEKNMTPQEFREAYVRQQMNLNERWKNVYAKQKQVYTGLLSSLGMATKTAQDFLSALNAKTEAWTKFYNEIQPEAFAEYLEACKPQEGDTYNKYRNGKRVEKGTWNVRVGKAWAEYKKTVNSAVKSARSLEAKQQAKMDKALVAGMKIAVGTLHTAEVDEKIGAKLQEIQNLKKQISEASDRARAVADQSALYQQKNLAWEEPNNERRNLILQYKMAQEELYNNIASLAGFATNKEAETPSEEVDHIESMKADIAQEQADEMQPVAEQTAEQTADEQLAESDGEQNQDTELQNVKDQITEKQKQLSEILHSDNPDKAEVQRLTADISKLNKQADDIYKMAYDVLTADNAPNDSVAPESWSMKLTAKTAFTAAKKLGYSDEQAIAYAQLWKARKQNFERNNPGKKFNDYGMTLEYSNEEKTVPVQGADGQLYQVETIDRADVNTPEFKAWHGDHPENFKDGKPLSVFHGSKAWFDHFRRDLLGSFTNAVSAKMGFFFASSKKNSEHYAKYASSRLNLAEEYLYDALDIDLEKMFSNAENDIEWASNNQNIFPNGLKDYINPNDILNNAERIRNEFLDEFGEDAGIFEPFIKQIKENRQDYEEFLASIQSGKKKLDADAYEPYYKNIEEYIDSYKFNREKYSDPADVTEDVLREIRKEYQTYYNKFLDFGIEIDRVYPKLEYLLQELRYPQTLSQNDALFIANELNYYNSIFHQLLADTLYFGLLSKAEMQELLAGKDLTSETVFGHKFTNADKLRNLESEYFKAVLRLDLYSKAIRGIFFHDDVKENFNRILNTPEDPNVREFYLSFKNPYIVDYKKRNRANVIRYSQAIKYAIDNGYDAVILKNTYDPYLTDIYVVFNEDQMKSVYNSGEWSDPKNVYHQEQAQRVKGQFSIQDGQKLIELFKGSDFSTLIHETCGHGWTTTLNDSQMEALAAYNGWTVDRYRQLENQWYYSPESMSEADRTAWVDSQERFAYGFEQYLLNGVAPSTKMKQVFENFRRFLLDIYKGIKQIIYKGEPIDIYESRNGVALYQIFDSMLEDYEGREFAIDRTNLQDIEGKSITEVNGDGSYGFAIPEEMREMLMTETAKQGEKVNKIKTSAEEIMRNETQEFLDKNVAKWGLTEAETQELVTEMMHMLGLNQDLPEDPVLMDSIEEKLKRFPGGEKAIREFVRSHRNTAAKISDTAIDAMLNDIDQGDVWNQSFGYAFHQTEQQPSTAEDALMAGKFVRLEDVDLTKITDAGDLDTKRKELAKKLYDIEHADKGRKKYHSLEAWRAFVSDEKWLPRKEASGMQTLLDMSVIYESKDNAQPLYTAEMRKEVENLRKNKMFSGDIPMHGTYISQVYSFDHGGQKIVAKVYNNGEAVAYVPEGMTETSFEYEGQTYPILGLSPKDPEMRVYKSGDVVKTEKRKTTPDNNPFQPEVKPDTIAMEDPVPAAHNEIAYDKVLPILEKFRDEYRRKVEDAVTGNSEFSSLDENTRSLVRSYIDTDVRSDLQNTKFKAGQFGTMMRDAALLNYSKRYGFDNFLTLLCPYQFWNTRSFMNWMSRAGSKGGKLWRRYEKLKKLERRNKKEFMPSKVSGKIGLYIPGLPDWMGDAVFMGTDQLLIVNQFAEFLEGLFSMNDKNAVIATAEQDLLQQLQDELITYQEYKAAIDPNSRESNPLWQEALSKAQMDSQQDNNIQSQVESFLGTSIPYNIWKSVSSDDQSAWNQFPMTRLGTAFRATFGGTIGKLGEQALSAPERLLRSVVAEVSGNDKFRYNEFGAFGDYYIRNQVFDMMMDGRISPEDAIQASIEKDGNKIWEEAADRQREEVLVKMQGGLAVDAAKKMFNSDKEDDIVGNWKELLAVLATSPFSKQIVHSGDTEWRKERAEQKEAYALKDAGDKNAVNEFNEKNPNYRYNSLRWEDDPEQALRKYLYNNINQTYYSLDKAEQKQIEMTFGPEFRRDVLDKETRAIESMDIDRLAAYAQTLNGSIPYLATDKLNTKNIQPYNKIQIPKNEMEAYNLFVQQRDKLYPGMTTVNNIYWSLPVNERKVFLQANPKLDEYQKWNAQYKKDHPEYDKFNKLSTSYYDMKEAEDVFSMMDNLTMKELTACAYSGDKINSAYKPIIERMMKQVGSTKTYDKFVDNLLKYILGE